jgi:hypothetical protein
VVCIGCDFSSAKVVDRGVVDRHIVEGRVADGCAAYRRVFYKQDPRRSQRLAFGSLINLNRRSRTAVIKIRRRGLLAVRKKWAKFSRSSERTLGGWNRRREAQRRRFDYKQSRRGEVPRAATVFWRLECGKAKEIDHGASVW